MWIRLLLLHHSYVLSYVGPRCKETLKDGHSQANRDDEKGKEDGGVRGEMRQGRELMRAANYSAAFTAILTEIGMSKVVGWLRAYDDYS